jgi:hypothetical protein
MLDSLARLKLSIDPSGSFGGDRSRVFLLVRGSVAVACNWATAAEGFGLSGRWGAGSTIEPRASRFGFRLIEPGSFSRFVRHAGQVVWKRVEKCRVEDRR